MCLIPIRGDNPLRCKLWLTAIFVVSAAVTGGRSAEAALFSGTIFIDPDIITSADTTTFTGITATGTGSRLMFDRRVNSWVTLNALLFQATYGDGLSIEVQVNPEFSASEAATEALKYATVVGRLPTALRVDVETMWIHKGVQPFGGGNNNLLIHTGQGDNYAVAGILEETFVHEAAHTSLDAAHAASAGWLLAQSGDGEFISDYAEANPTQEDIAESFLTWLAVRHRADRISPELYQGIVDTIPNRLAYFDEQAFDMFPITQAAAVPEPSSFVLFSALGGLVFLLNRRRTGLVRND
jgi:hypothetical protein